MLRTSPVRVLDDRDLDTAREVLRRDPVTNVFVASRVEACGLSPSRLGAEVWGYAARHGTLSALCYVGANLVPAGADELAARAFAERARRAGRHCSSIVGPVAAVDVMWAHLQGAWGAAREIRRPQPHLAIDTPPLVPSDPSVRRVRPEEIDIVLPACVAMFTEEVGVSPTSGDGGALYRARVAELIADGRSFARIEDGQVVFKAEIGAATRDACQVQGVWVDPRLRGQGLGTAGTAAVVELARSSVAPTVSLYVNDFNVAARTAYARVGFREVGAFSSILF
ncbi:MAG TPA: GNAT family N-acetyltransferase [Mycobacteriales bacterium]|nr:GNAT family N-acetyltransferase [Mycobacteriales bacterium]